MKIACPYQSQSVSPRVLSHCHPRSYLHPQSHLSSPSLQLSPPLTRTQANAVPGDCPPDRLAPPSATQGASPRAGSAPVSTSTAPIVVCWLLATLARFEFAAEGAVWGVLADCHPGVQTPGYRHPLGCGSRELESNICGRQGRRLRKVLRIWI